MNRNKTNAAGQGELSAKDYDTRWKGTMGAMIAWAAYLTGLFWYFLW